MATSGTYSWAPNRAQVKQDALEMVGGDVYGETDAAVNASADSSLNGLIKALNVNKTDIQVIVKSTIETVNGTASYALPTGAIGVDSVYITVNENGYPLTPLTKDQYYGKGLKAATGRPSEFYHDRQANLVYLYPVPDSAYTVTYGKISQFQDMTEDEQNFDFPAAAIEMLTFGLAHRLSMKRSGMAISEKDSLEKQFEKAKRRYEVGNYDYTKGQTSTSSMVV